MSKINPYLFIGDKNHASNEAFLNGNNIKVIVNCTSSVPNHFEGQYDYLKLNMWDRHNQDLRGPAEMAKNKIMESTRGGLPVLVHCEDGISLSPSVVLYVLMQINDGWSYDTALKYLREFHPNTKPNAGFIQKLAGDGTVVSGDLIPVEGIDTSEFIENGGTTVPVNSNSWSSLRLDDQSASQRPKFASVGGRNYGRIFSNPIPISSEDPMKQMRKQ